MSDYKEIARLVVLAQGGDQAAFSTLYEKYQLQFYYLAIKLVKNPSDAADMVQDAMLDLYLNIEKVKDPMAFSAFAKQVITRKCLHFLNSRKEQIHRDSVDEEPDGLEENIDFLPEASLENQEMREEILNIIDNLPDNLRVVIVLFYYQQLSMAEIGAALDLSVKNVSVRLSRARAAMKKQLDIKGVSGRALYGGGGALLLKLFERQFTSDSAAFSPPSLPTFPLPTATPPASAPFVSSIAERATAIVAAAAIIVTGVAVARAQSKDKPAPSKLTTETAQAAPTEPEPPKPAEIIDVKSSDAEPLHEASSQDEPPIIDEPQSPSSTPAPQTSPKPIGNPPPQALWVPELLIGQREFTFTLGEQYTAEDLVSMADIRALDRRGDLLPIELSGYGYIDWNKADTYNVTVHIPATEDSEERWDFLLVQIGYSDDTIDDELQETPTP